MCKWVYLPLLLLFLFSPPPRLCLKACVAKERKRWDVVIVTVSQLIGRTVVVLTQWRDVRLHGVSWPDQACDDALRGFQDSWTTGSSRSPLGTLGESAWTRSNSLSPRPRKPARLMFIHYTSVLSPTESVLSVLASLMFQMPH